MIEWGEPQKNEDQECLYGGILSRCSKQNDESPDAKVYRIGKRVYIISFYILYIHSHR